MYFNNEGENRSHSPNRYHDIILISGMRLKYCRRYYATNQDALIRPLYSSHCVSALLTRDPVRKNWAALNHFLLRVDGCSSQFLLSQSLLDMCLFHELIINQMMKLGGYKPQVRIQSICAHLTSKRFYVITWGKKCDFTRLLKGRNTFNYPVFTWSLPPQIYFLSRDLSDRQSNLVHKPTTIRTEKEYRYAIKTSAKVGNRYFRKRTMP